MGETRGHHVGESINREAGALLDELLASLLDDFEHWFQRGEELLQNCPDAVMSPEESGTNPASRPGPTPR
jgi:hypothetical protein